MSMSDPIADLLPRTLNSQMVANNSVHTPFYIGKIANDYVVMDDDYIAC